MPTRRGPDEPSGQYTERAIASDKPNEQLTATLEVELAGQ